MDVEEVMIRVLCGLAGALLGGAVVLAAGWGFGDGFNPWHIGIGCGVGFAVCAVLKERAIRWLGELLWWS